MNWQKYDMRHNITILTETLFQGPQEKNYVALQIADCLKILNMAVNKWFSHLINDRAWLGFSQFEHTFNNRELSRRGVWPTEGSPVIHSNTSSNDLTASVHSPCNERDLKKSRKFVKILNGCVWMNLFQYLKLVSSSWCLQEYFPPRINKRLM